jgi:hypothetical protein
MLCDANAACTRAKARLVEKMLTPATRGGEDFRFSAALVRQCRMARARCSCWTARARASLGLLRHARGAPCNIPQQIAAMEGRAAGADRCLPLMVHKALAAHCSNYRRLWWMALVAAMPLAAGFSSCVRAHLVAARACRAQCHSLSFPRSQALNCLYALPPRSRAPAFGDAG